MTRISAETGGARHHSRKQKRQKLEEDSAEPVGLRTAIELQGRPGMNVTSKRTDASLEV
jgi:hypothetical protein